MRKSSLLPHHLYSAALLSVTKLMVSGETGVLSTVNKNLLFPGTKIMGKTDTIFAINRIHAVSVIRDEI